MRIWPLMVLSSVALAVVISPAFSQQKSDTAPPKYNATTEATFKGTVDEVSNHECPLVVGMGAHVILKMEDGKTIEVHLAPVKFLKLYDLVLTKGDQLEVTGSKVQLDGADTILAREIKRKNDTFTFRDQKGKPVW